MEDYIGKLEVCVHDGWFYEITESEHVKEMPLKMWDKTCDILNDDPGLITVLNNICNVRHPHENPIDSKELRYEYDRLHDQICGDVWEALSWSEGVDLDNRKRYVLLRVPYFSKHDRVWRFSLRVNDL